MRFLREIIPQSVINIYHFIVAIVSIARFGYPARSLKVIGVTGTDGKTTTTTLIYHILKSAQIKVAMVSSVAAYIGDKKLETGLHVTSPGPWELQRLLKEVADKGFEYVVLEATSHGLDQHRLLGTNIEIGVLTNITPEHMLYHKTMKHYMGAKSKLFRGAKTAILNKDDKSFNQMKSMINDETRVVTYGRKTFKGRVRKAIELRFVEDFNQLNAAASALVAKEIGVGQEDIADALTTFPGVSGRVEEITNDQGIKIIVDFAHTPNGLKSVLSDLSKQKRKSSRLIVVFGCASERDDEKRPVMGGIATSIADISVFTAEDPRYEDVNKIIGEMVEGAKKEKNAKEVDPHLVKQKRLNKHVYMRVPERGEAIALVINTLAKRGDIVVICGKGHERSMSYNGVEYPWSDHEAVKMALKGRVKKIKRN